MDEGKEVRPMLGLTRRDGEPIPARPGKVEGKTIPERWDPWSEFTRLQTEMDRLFTGLLRPAPRVMEGIPTFAPAVDLYETAEEVVMNAYLPGISREDIHLEVIGDTLRIAGETKAAVPEKDVTVHALEGGYGRFDLRYTLPVAVKTEACKAIYRNGVLEVRMPKVEEVKAKPIEIRVEG
jgi:HSP20 family protein